MPEMVYRAGIQGKSLHSDPECPRLNQANTIIGPRPKDLYADHYDLCDWCGGDTPHGDGGDRSFNDAIKAIGENNA